MMAGKNQAALAVYAQTKVIFPINFNRIFMRLAVNLDRYKISEEFHFGPDRTIDFGVACPLVPCR